MKILRATVLIALLAGPAYAQAPNINLLADTEPKSPEQLEKEQARDKAYKETLKKIPDAKTSSDPWGAVRSTEEAKPAPKPRAKTSTNKTSANKASAN